MADEAEFIENSSEEVAGEGEGKGRRKVRVRNRYVLKRNVDHGFELGTLFSRLRHRCLYNYITTSANRDWQARTVGFKVRVRVRVRVRIRARVGSPSRDWSVPSEFVMPMSPGRGKG